VNIAVVGWGSLVWDPQDLKLAVGEWATDGPSLPIEFARASQKTARLTLVICPPGNQPARGAVGRDVTALWALSGKTELSAAIRDLAFREGCGEHMIGRCTKESAPSEGTVEASVIGWLRQKGGSLDAAIWTNLHPNLPPDGSRSVTLEAVLRYLRELKDQGREGASVTYVKNAPPQIQTPFRPAIEHELGIPPV
jgi:hypothetical protein